MKRLLVPLVALVVMSTGCDAVGGNDVAATVDGNDISVVEVRELAAAIVKTGGQESESTEDVLDGTEGRNSLTQWVQLEALHSEFARRGESLGQDDRSQASQQVKGLKGLSGDTRRRLTSLLAEAIAMDRILGASATPTPDVPEPTDEEVAAAAAQLLDTVPVEERTLQCSNAIAGPTSAADQVQALLDGGTDITDATAFADLQFATPSASNPLCVSPGQLPTELQGPYTSTAVGQLGRADFAGQGGQQTLFFVPTGPRTLTADDPEVVAAARQQLEQSAQEKAQAGQAANQDEIAKVYRKIFRTTDIDVDPRFGRFDVTGTIEPPIAPLAPRSATTTLPTGATP